MKKILTLLAVLLTFTAQAQESRIGYASENVINAAESGWQARLGAGYLIGGTAPLPIPRAIRGIEGFNPGVNFSLEASMQKVFAGSRWGVQAGLRFDTKGMTTDANTKNYHMEMSNADGSKIVGSWTGKVKTHVNNTYVSVPLLATYSINERWTLSAGAYASLLIKGEFNGEAYDGYIRDQNPTGEKTEVSSAQYDFSDDIVKFNWGIQAGGEYRIYRHLAVFANLQWGLNGIFPEDYSCVPFALKPIYATIGFNYLF